MSHIYLIAEGPEGPTKIGHAKNAFSRLSAIQTGNPRPLALVAIWEVDDADARFIEMHLHADFEPDNCRMAGEWFDIAPDPIIDCVPDSLGAIGCEAKRIR